MTRTNPDLLDALTSRSSQAPGKSRKASAAGSASASPQARNANYRELFQRIQRRNGEIAEFDKRKITEAIWKAARSVGGTDRRVADLLADKVILYLSRTHDDHLLTIEEVQDAVEKVLIEEGHAKTAKAYILYREQRARVRRFRQARRSSPSSAAVVGEIDLDREVEVLTSGDQVVHWNRERIIQALVRETGLALSLAEQISREVERQIIYSKTSRLTASLIRELVNVKLIEYGFSNESQLHSRLGVPLFDVEQMILGRGAEGRPGPLETTLSGSIVRQYALERVFSSEVSNAHLQGDLFLHGLTDPWRPEESIQSLEYLKKAGLCLPDFPNRWSPAETAFELVAQMGKFNALLSGSVRRWFLWDAVNVFLAPLLDGKSEDAFRAVARALLLQSATRPSHGVPRAAACRLGFYFHVPKTLWNTAALGPCGKYTGKTYAYYEETARRFLQAFLQVLAEGDADGQPATGPEFCFHLDEQFFADGHAAEDLQRLEEHLPRVGRWCAWFHDDHPASKRFEHFSRTAEGDPPAPEFKYPWKMRSSVHCAVTINLPALALRAEGNTEELYTLAEQQIHLAFTAFRQQKQFLDRLEGRGLEAPVPRIVHRGDGEPFLRAGQQYRRIALWGLEEMAQRHTDREPKEDAACREFIHEFLQHTLGQIELGAQSSRLPCEAGLQSEAEAEARFRRSGTGKEQSTNARRGRQRDALPAAAFDASPGAAQTTATNEIVVSPQQLSEIGGAEPSLAQLLKRGFERGREERLVVKRPLWICQTCSRMTSGSPDICPHCGSLQLSLMES